MAAARPRPPIHRYAADGTLVRTTRSTSANSDTTTTRMIQDWAAGLPRVLATTIIVKQGVFTTEDLPTDTIYGLERLWSATGNGSKLTRTWFLPDGLGSPLMTTDKHGSPPRFAHSRNGAHPATPPRHRLALWLHRHMSIPATPPGAWCISNRPIVHRPR